MADLGARLEAALGDAFRLERELGGGGMSHVFLAEERVLSRKLVIKVLPPEMLAGGRIAEAIASYRRWHDEAWCVGCGLFELAAAYQQARQPDSAAAFCERAVTTPAFRRVFVDAFTLPAVPQPLGELYEERGERAQALHSYQRLVDLWKDADPELRPAVRDVRARMARLASEH